MHEMHAWAYHSAWLLHWSKGDYVSAKINTRIYMGLMVATCVGMVMRPEMSPPFSIQKVEIVLRDV